MMARQLSLQDHAALAYLSDGHTTATHHVARACGLTPCNAHRARTVLKRLERWGLVEGITAPHGGAVYWWRITDAGRKALQP